MADKKKEVAIVEEEVAIVEEEVKDLSIFAVEEGQEEHLSQDELELPFLRVAQKGSPQVDDDKAEFIEGLKAGNYFSTLSSAVFGDSLKVQAHGYFHNYTIWQGEKGNGTYQGTMTTDEFRAFEKTTKLERDGGDMVHTVDGETLRYTDTHNFIVSLPDHPEEGIMLYPLSSTGCKAARKWNSLNNGRRIPGGKQAKRYATLWEIKTAGFESNGFTYKQTSSIKPLSWVTAELNELGKSFEEFVKAIKENGVKHADEKTATESPEDSEF